MRTIAGVVNGIKSFGINQHSTTLLRQLHIGKDVAKVVIENLSKIFQGPGGELVCALRDVNLVIEDKELVVLVGPSGCGKTTILRLIAGLEEITAGTVSVNGSIVNNLPPKERDIAMVFQNYALYPHMTVYGNLALGLKLRKFPKAEIQQRVRETAEVLGLTPCLDRRPSALSGGERQRVALGRAMVRHPKVFLLDEPLSNLDAPMRAQMRAEIARLHRRLGATMLYVTHDQVEAMTMGDRIVVLKEGVIQQVADPVGLYERPANLFVAGFIGSPPMNFCQGTLIRKGAGLAFVQQSQAGGEPALIVPVLEAQAALLRNYIGQHIILGIRPEHFHLGGPETGTKGVLQARVEVVEPMGSETFLHLTSPKEWVMRVPASQRVEVGQMLTLQLEMNKAHWFDSGTHSAIRQDANG